MKIKGIGFEHIVAGVMFLLTAAFLLLVLTECFERSVEEPQKACQITDATGEKHDCDPDNMSTRCLSILMYKLTTPATTTEPVQEATTTPVEANEAVSGTIRQVTAYNVGDPKQTDDTPCIGAGTDDLCDIIKTGKKVCAANFVPLGTWLRISNYGDCQVLDRTAKKYSNRVDVAMSADEYDRAINFGRQNLLVEIIK